MNHHEAASRIARERLEHARNRAIACGRFHNTLAQRRLGQTGVAQSFDT